MGARKGRTGWLLHPQVMVRGCWEGQLGGAYRWGLGWPVVFRRPFAAVLAYYQRPSPFPDNPATATVPTITPLPAPCSHSHILLPPVLPGPGQGRCWAVRERVQGGGVGGAVHPGGDVHQDQAGAVRRRYGRYAGGTGGTQAVRAAVRAVWAVQRCGPFRCAGGTGGAAGLGCVTAWCAAP